MPEYEVSAVNVPTDEFVRAYLECAEWADVYDDQQTEFGNAERVTWDAESIADAEQDCAEFQALAHCEISDLEKRDAYDASQAGHDFWLTRNGHGAGFWDRDYPDAIGKKLTEHAQTFSELHVWFDAKSETLTLE